MNFYITSDQIDQIEKWKKEHNCSLPEYRGAIGGGSSYCFYPTSLGISLVFKCDCGGEIDVTDYEGW